MVERITYNDLELYQPQNGRPLLDPVCELEAGAAGSLSFRIPPTHPYHDLKFAIRNASNELRYYQDGEEMFRGRITKLGEDDLGCIVVEAEGQLAYLGDSVVRPYATYDAKDTESGTVYVGGDLFEWEVAEHAKRVGPEKTFQVGKHPIVQQQLVNASYPTTLDDLKDVFCEGQDRYLRARSMGDERYLDLLDGGVGEGTQAIVLGENLLSVEATRDAGEIVTAIIPVGRKAKTEAAEEEDPYYTPPDDPEQEQEYDPDNPPESKVTDGQIDRSIDNGYRDESYTFTIRTLIDGGYSVGDTNVRLSNGVVVNPELVALYGVIEEKREYECEDQEELLRCAAADLSLSKLANQEISSVVVSAIDLHALNPDVAPIRLLDWYHVFSKSHGIDQWIPCSKMHITIGNPATSTYRFGDLPATLTRRSALRMGMLRRGNGELIRRQNGSAWNTSRAWDKAEEVGKETGELEGAFDKWKTEQDATNTSVFAGLDALILQYTELGGNITDLRDYMDGEIDKINDSVIDGVGEAIAAAQRTQYGVCPTPAATLIKEVTVSVPGDVDGKYPFKLVKGATCTVYFQHENEQSGIYLSVNGTTARQIYTNGAPEAFWLAGATVPFVYDGQFWQNCSVPVFGSEATIGDPGQANFYTDGLRAQMRIGDIDYWNTDMSGTRIGREGDQYTKIKIGSDDIKMIGWDGLLGKTRNLSFEMGQGADRTPNISSSTSLTIGASDGGSIFLGGNGSRFDEEREIRISAAGGVTLGGAAPSYMTHLTVNTTDFRFNYRSLVFKSIVKTVGNSDYLKLGSSDLGETSGGYAWVVENGDQTAFDFYVVGTAIARDGGLWVKFDRMVDTTVRLNIFGWPTNIAWPSDPANPEGPEIFADPQEPEQPTTEEANNAA